jgi:beta-lactam-binding protein with PASTA domain/predicted Ser/Thr protein kinase
LKDKVIGERYELLEEIGEGGMATVFKAHCRSLDRIVAVKILKDEFSQDQVFVQSFKTEALAVARLSHPNIVNIFDVGQEGNVHYIVMEYIEGQTLQEVIAAEAPLATDKAVEIAIMICEGIHHAHENGIIHRDIKPHNILITKKGIVKVADFGIAQAISKKTLTFARDLVGTVHYISPEQAKGEPVTPATDIYSLGCVLYEMLTGKPPFDAESSITVALKHIHDEPLPPQKINPAAGDAVSAIIFRAMEKVPTHRFSSAEEMRNALFNLDGSLNMVRKDRNGATIIMSPIQGGNNPKRGKRRIRPAGLAIVAVAVLGLLSGIWYVMGGSLFGKEVQVPDLQNMEMKEAREVLAAYGLKIAEAGRNFSDEVEKDRIISQQPAAEQTVKTGREIAVILSKGPEMVTVPYVVGLKQGDAEIQLRNNGLLPMATDQSYDDRFQAGMVISQDPVSGGEAAKGSKVVLLISKGKAPPKVPMPKLVGLTLEKAKQKLADNNLKGEITRQNSSTYKADVVMTQDTTEGVLIDEGSTVKLVVSDGAKAVAKTSTLPFTLPREQKTYRVTITVSDSQGSRHVYDQTHSGGTAISVAVSYYDSGKAEVKLDSERFKVFTLK